MGFVPNNYLLEEKNKQHTFFFLTSLDSINKTHFCNSEAGTSEWSHRCKFKDSYSLKNFVHQPRTRLKISPLGSPSFVLTHY